MDKKFPQRTTRQNAAIHVLFKELADELNGAGLTMQRVLKPGVDISWTPESIKTYIWKPVQEAMFNKKSTTELDTKQVDQVFEIINHHLGEKFGISIQFPSIKEILFQQSVKEKHGQ